MIEEVLITYLSGALNVPVYAEEPAGPPATYVLVEKTGGGGRDHIHTGTFAIQSYAPTKYAAASLNLQVKRAMAAADTAPEITRASLNSDYNFTDTATKRYRYQAVYDLTYYEEDF